MINILQKHLVSYPKIEIKDVAKLIYQSEFGGGHLIKDGTYSLKRIQEEYQSLNNKAKTNLCDIEFIGDGMCRLYLSCISNGLKPEVLNQMFVHSANHRVGTLDNLRNKIKICLEACESGVLPLSKEVAVAFFENWKSQGYPAISHSDIYRENYSPAYRVIEESYVRIYEIIRTIQEQQPSIIAIDGMSASGKTTMGNLLHMQFPNSNLFHMDDYFLQPHQRTTERLSEIGGNIDYERFRDEVILHLNDKNGLSFRKFDCRTQTLGDEIYVPWKPLVIIEGAYSQHPYWGDIYDLRIFSEISKKEQRERILIRNGAEMLKRFENEWIPKENAYFEFYHIKGKSGLQ